MTAEVTIPVEGIGYYKPIQIYRVEAKYIEADKETPYVAMFEAIPCIEGVAAMIKHASDSMFEAAKTINPAARDVINPLRAQAAAYARLAALVRTRATWPEDTYRSGYALLSLANAVDREMGQLLLTTTHYWGLRNA